MSIAYEAYLSATNGHPLSVKAHYDRGMNAPADFAARIAESRAKHLVPAIGAVWIGPDGLIHTVEHGELQPGAFRGGSHLWHIGSCTKAMTATVFARLVNQKRITFETPLAEALPKLAPRMAAGFRDMPLSALLTHSAGIKSNPALSTFVTLRLSTASATAQRRFLSALALRDEPRFSVGYSNLGYIVLGSVIEEVTGLPWEAALAREVMIPLGIARFGFGPPGPGHPVGHRRRANRWRAYRDDNPVAYGPAGRVHLALDEWGRFLRAHLREGSFLSAELLARLHAPNDDGFAMGWFERRLGRERRLVHTGSNTAWFAQATLAPERGVGLGIVCNAFDDRVEQAVYDLSRDLLDEDWGNGP